MATAAAANANRLREIKTFPSLVKYLRDDLDWPIESEGFEDITFDWQPEELGIDPNSAAKIQEIKQLRPFVDNQPWGIFFIKFEPRKLPVVALRRILRALVIKKRGSATSADRKSWDLHDLLFISLFGGSDHREIAFAHFAEEPELGDLPTLRVLGWDDENTPLHLDHADRELREKLRWPAGEPKIENWRQRWSSAFNLRIGEVVSTAKAMAERLAELAGKIRKRVNAILKIESENGSLRKLHKAFREALIHDLTEDDFADMYAQTISYGLLTARISRPTGLVGDNLRDMVPVTNPFLRDLLETFLTVGGRKGKIDFDELGVSEVVQMLRKADMEGVLRDFGDRNPQEDPAIHFYVLFLKEYDPEKQVKRGVFYTPRPVVSYIVRSVHELLKTEFGLPEGLASTVTWTEMAKRHPGLRIPEGTAGDSPFVQILDPAVGTGTFLVEVIDVIHSAMQAKWQKEGRLALESPKLWNEYVSKHLLPRLHGYELMMAPYAIAHMKIGLKLHETGYRFGSHERARVYLTNSLEPPHDFSDRLPFDAPALAHEAKAVNAIKRHQRFTVVIANPPYSGISSNMTEHAQRIVDAYKIVDGKALNERKLWLQDDYVKFIRIGQEMLQHSSCGVLGYITNHGYLDNPTFRGMRWSLLQTFPHISVLDLHGNSKKKQFAPDGSSDVNVFDIQQGVALTLLRKRSPDRVRRIIRHSELWGSRESKYSFLAGHGSSSTAWNIIQPEPEGFLLIPYDSDSKDEYERGWKVTDIFPVSGVGVVTSRDSMTVDFDADGLWTRVKDFVALPVEKARDKYALGKDARDWRVQTAQADVRDSGPSYENIIPILYRPFDFRFTYYTGHSRGFYASPCEKVMGRMIGGENKALIIPRSVEIGRYEHAFCTNRIIGHHSVSLKEVNYLFPIWLPIRDSGRRTLLKTVKQSQLNLSVDFLRSLAGALDVRQDAEAGLPEGLTAEEIFHYLYAVLHSLSYRTRYFEFLKQDFAELFRALSRIGGLLASIHLLESPTLSKHLATYRGSARPEIEKVLYERKVVWLDKDQTCGFEGVPEAVWSFRVGGYQVCEKWLKDRKGRKLLKDDIEHYQRVIVAIAETIRLMKEIDVIIDEHGGWPGAFSAGRVDSSRPAGAGRVGRAG
jgi:predicted helicase